MMKKEKGITLVSLVITVAVLLIISAVTVNTSLDRFEINKLNKMYSDINLLTDKVSNYYLKYKGLPLVKDSNNNLIEYTYSKLNFEESGKYYIVDLSAMEGILLNYGEYGYKMPNKTNDVYVINNDSHKIYYVKGIEMDGNMYYTISAQENQLKDTIPPTKPEIKIISGIKNKENIYTTDVAIEFIQGKDNWSGILKTEYSINNGNTWKNINELANNIYKISENGTYNIMLRCYDQNGNMSETVTETIQINKINLNSLEQENVNVIE